MANLDEIRKIVDDYIGKRGYTYRDISLKIGRKDSYIQQYIKYGFPKRLNEVDRKKIEKDSKNPRYLQTIRGKGYMLLPE